MAQNAKTPKALATSASQENVLLPGKNSTKNSYNFLEAQALVAPHIARRFRIAPHLARTVCELASIGGGLR